VTKVFIKATLAEFSRLRYVYVVNAAHCTSEWQQSHMPCLMMYDAVCGFNVSTNQN